MADTGRFYIARILLSDDSVVRGCLEHFILIPEHVEEEQRIAYALESWRFGSRWIADNPTELSRFALLLRQYAHSLAAVIEENHRERFPNTGLDVLQEVLLRPSVRERLSQHLAPALASYLWPGANEPLAPEAIAVHWRQCLDGKGRFSHHLNAVLSLYHRTAAEIAASTLGDQEFQLRPLDGQIVTSIPIPLEFFAGSPKYLHVMNSLPYHAVREVLAFGQFQRTEDSPWPTAPLKKGSTNGHAQLFPVEMETDPYRESHEQKDLAELMWMQVSELSDLDADVLDLLSALWVQQARSPNDVAKVSVKNLLRMRGLKPKTGAGGRSSGFRPDQKQQLFRSLAHIQNIYLLIQDMELPGSERDSGRHKESREVRSRAFIITDIAGKRTENGPLDIEEFLIRPGVLFGYFLFGHGRQIALLSAKAIEYDRIRQDWEKRLARYFSWQWRNDALNQRGSRKFLVRTLLENTGKKADPLHPKRTKERLEKALDTLAADQVIGSWAWDTESPRFGVSGRWTDHWESWSIEIAAPEYVRQHYQKILPGNGPSGNLSSLPSSQVQELPISDALFRYRQQNQLSQSAMAGKLGITQSFYSLLERGSRNANPTLLKSIRQLLYGPI